LPEAKLQKHRALLRRLRHTIFFVILSFAKNLVFVTAH